MFLLIFKLNKNKKKWIILLIKKKILKQNKTKQNRV